MDFQAIRKLMNKLDQVMELYSDHETLSISEKELMVDYLKRIHALIQNLPSTADDLHFVNPFAKESGSGTPAGTESGPAPSSPIVPPAANVETNLPPRVLSESQASSDETRKEDPGMEESSKKFDHLFEVLKISDLSEKLELVPIRDLRSGMGLNEKILAQNELFGGNRDIFEQVLNDLNQCAGMDEARKYLVKNVIQKFGWDQPDKLRFVESFLKLVQRRHL
jgi:hypothetical protein